MILINSDCINALKDNKIPPFDGVITSPPYNTCRATGDEYNTRYSQYKDTRTNEEYIDWQTELFVELEKKLNKDGVILYNINYGGENTDTMWMLLANIIQKTNLIIADQITWKKRSAIPNNVSKNALTRICENIFVFVRKSEVQSFNTNKKVLSISKKGQKIYETFYNYIEAKNNDQGDHTKLHKATFSVDLCTKLLNMYIPPKKTVYDPFMGTGTTGIACYENGRDFIGTEIDPLYYKIAKDRIEQSSQQLSLF